MTNNPDVPANPNDAVAEAAATPPAPPLSEINSEDLFKGAREVLIRHRDEIYRLRLTKNDRLILHK